MTPPNARTSGEENAPVPAKRRYEKPRLIDYGLVSKLTLAGGITTHDNGNMFRQCL